MRLIEGHGSGTAARDDAELLALSELRALIGSANSQFVQQRRELISAAVGVVAGAAVAPVWTRVCGTVCGAATGRFGCCEPKAANR